MQTPKRARIDPIPSISPAKRERSPSPLLIERRLVTSGTRRFAPIPDNCRSSCAEFRRNRSAWAEKCVKELEELNLVPERKLVRDDGLSIDWKSDVPVWSDTLKPASLDLAATIVLTHTSNAQLYHRSPSRAASPRKSVATISTSEHSTSTPPICGDIPDAEPPSKKRLPAPPRASSMRPKPPSRPISVSPFPNGSGSSFPSPQRPRATAETECETISHLPLYHHVSNVVDRAASSDGSTQPPKPPNGVPDGSIVPHASSAEEEEITEMTLSYLCRYIQTYEGDRASLASAYARNASFAYRVHHIVPNIHHIAPNTSDGALSAWAKSPRCFSSGTKQNRLDIVTTLLNLPGLHSNAPSADVAQIEYDMFYLGAAHGMFVVGRVVISSQTVVHNFILQRKEVDMEDAAIEGVWPLTATAHQILVFQT